MNALGLEDLRELLEKIAPNTEPYIDRIDFHYEEVTTRDGGGVVRTSYLIPTGATIEIRVS